jgi:hypothetical protein
MASGATPSATNPKMKELVCKQTAQLSAHHTFAEDGYTLNIARCLVLTENVVRYWLFLAWIWHRQMSDKQLVTQKIQKQKHLLTMVAAVVPWPPWCATPPGATKHNNQAT